MIQRIVHIEPITILGQKIQFQIKLPRDVKRILSIHQTTTASVELSEDQTHLFAPEVGDLWLRVANKYDVFYTATLQTAIDHYHNISDPYLPIPDFGGGRFWTEAKKITFFDIPTELDINLIEGYYEDRQDGLGQSYQLRIYLTIQR